MFASQARTTASKLCIVVLAAFALTACEDEESTSADPAEITLSFSPAIATASTSPRDGFAWRTTFSVVVAETQGVGGTITAINSTLYEAAGGIVVGTPDQDEDVVVSVSAPSNRIDAFGSATATLTIDYRLSGDGREALVDVTISITDDNDQAVSETERVSVV